MAKIELSECAVKYMAQQFVKELDDYIPKSVIDDIKAEIQAKYDVIPWRENENSDGWIEALEWVLEIIDRHINGKEQE